MSTQKFREMVNDAIREQRLTQMELSAKSGVSQSTISGFCKGTHEPKLSTAIALADALGIRLLIEFDEEEEPEPEQLAC